MSETNFTSKGFIEPNLHDLVHREAPATIEPVGLSRTEASVVEISEWARRTIVEELDLFAAFDELSDRELIGAVSSEVWLDGNLEPRQLCLLEALLARFEALLDASESVETEQPEPPSESESLLANLWHGIELDVAARGFSKIRRSLIETLYREISCPTDFGFIGEQSRGLSFSVMQTVDSHFYVFRKPHQLPVDEKVLIETYNGRLQADLERDMPCALCHCRLDEHPPLAELKIEQGSRAKRIMARAGCDGAVLFEKRLEV